MITVFPEIKPLGDTGFGRGLGSGVGLKIVGVAGNQLDVQEVQRGPQFKPRPVLAPDMFQIPALQHVGRNGQPIMVFLN